jgi:hypothetical protein
MVDYEESIMKKPEWVVENEDGSYTIQTKEGDFVFEEQNAEVVDRVNRMSEKTSKDVESLLLVRSSVEPKLTDENLMKLKGSTYMRLKYGISFVYGLQDFI